MSKSYIPRLVETAVVLPLIAGIATTVQASPNPLKISPQSEVLTVQGRGEDTLEVIAVISPVLPTKELNSIRTFPIYGLKSKVQAIPPF